MAMEETIISGKWRGHYGRGLSPRELEFVLYLAQGMSSKEIAKAAGLSPGAVVKRVSNAMYKLKVTRRSALIAEAFKRQIITPI